MALKNMVSIVTVALLCASSVQSYVVPSSAGSRKGDLAEAVGGRLFSRSLDDTKQHGTFSVPVYRRHGDLHPETHKRDPERTRTWALRQAEIMKSKFGHGGKKGAHKRQTIGLVDVGQDSYYYAQLSLGTPAQNFNVVLDTGSADFWLVDTGCGLSNGCDSDLVKYNPSASSTNVGSSDPFSITYGTGAVRGTLAADKASLAGYTVENLTFGEASAVASNTVEYPTSGIMGMGFQSLASSGATPFWEVLAKQGVLKSNVFTFQLVRNIDNVDITDANVNSVQNPGGVFTLGEIDSNQYSGDITYIDIPNNLEQQEGLGYWTIPLGGITVNGNSANIGNGPLAAIDTGTTLIGGPQSAVRAFYSLISGAQTAPGMSGYYLFPCNSNLDIEMQFGGRSFQMNTQDFNLGPYPYTNSATCLGALFDIDLGSSQYGVPEWIVGDSFLKNVFSVYDGSGRVGFASLKGSEAQSVSVTSNAVPSQTGRSSSSSASSSMTGGGIPVPSGASTYGSGATATGIVGGGGLPTPSASSGVTSSNPTLQSGNSGSSSGSSGGSSSGVASTKPSSLLALSTAVVAAMFAGAGLVL
ncbi:acid protease [Testicularia cyperi]|uniref:Acid protease n=1 Tax=Testicularia cyperi TaxID=1882483 RepID=A0A317XTR2_9BASI|nr:acid protease [Testicularia cyperi]